MKNYLDALNYPSSYSPEYLKNISLRDIQGEKVHIVFEATQIWYKDICVLERDHRDTTEFKICLEEISYLNTQVYRNSALINMALDYVTNKDIELKPFFNNGNIRKLFWSNLQKRLEEIPSYPETERRAYFALNLVLNDSENKIPEEYKNYIRSHFVIPYGETSLKYTSSYETPLKKVNVFINALQTYKEDWFKMYSLKRQGTLYTLVSEQVDVSLIQGEYIPTCKIEKCLANGILFRCDECGSLSWEANTQFIEEETDEGIVIRNLCENCYNIPQLQIQRYRTNPLEFFDFKRSKHLGKKAISKYMGVELEYECKHKTKATSFIFKHLKQHAIMKEDGSLNNGIEICSAPADIDVHFDEFKSFFSSFDKNIIHAHSTTGMHVHVGKGEPIRDEFGEHISNEVLSPLTIGKICNFMANEKNKDFLIYIAGRESGRYAKLSTNDAVSTYFLGIEHDRYKALNTNNQNTIEFRLFATPETFQDFAKNLEFCDAITNYCLPTNSGIKDLTHEKFSNWVKNNRGRFKHLARFLFPALYKEKRI